MFLSETLEDLTPDQLKTLQPKINEIKIQKISGKLISQLSKDAASTIKKFYTTDAEQFGALQREAYRVLSTMVYWEKIYSVQNNKQQLEQLRAEIEKHFAALGNYDPRLRSSIEYAIYPEREPKDSTAIAIQ